jgi:hypothetical protein
MKEYPSSPISPPYPPLYHRSSPSRTLACSCTPVASRASPSTSLIDTSSCPLTSDEARVTASLGSLSAEQPERKGYFSAWAGGSEGETGSRSYVLSAPSTPFPAREKGGVCQWVYQWECQWGCERMFGAGEWVVFS